MKRRSITIVVSGLVLLASPWILAVLWLGGGTVYGQVEKWYFSPTDRFSAAEWQRPNMKYRYAVLDYVATKVVHSGMTMTEVERLLGTPDFVTDKGEWQYETKRPGWHFIDFSGGGLLIEFDADQLVVKVSQNLWVD